MVKIMEERASLKRSDPPVSFSECIICQESKKDVLFSATEQGLRSLKESSEEPRKLRDTINTDTIDRILSANDRKEAQEQHWHKSCYAKYTDKGKISRLRKLLDSTNAKQEISASTALRSKTSLTSWELCMFVKTGKRPKNIVLSYNFQNESADTRGSKM